MEFWHLLDRMKNNNKDFLLYGNLDAKNIIFLINSLGIKITGCIDDDPFMHGKTSRYGKIISFSDLIDAGTQKNYNYVIGIEYAISLKKKIMKGGGTWRADFMVKYSPIWELLDK